MSAQASLPLSDYRRDVVRTKWAVATYMYAPPQYGASATGAQQLDDAVRNATVAAEQDMSQLQKLVPIQVGPGGADYAAAGQLAESAADCARCATAGWSR